jgi:hypothetical protein
MEQAHRSNKTTSRANEKLHVKYTIGNCCLYQYRDSSGRIVQVSRPAFVKIKNID